MQYLSIDELPRVIEITEDEWNSRLLLDNYSCDSCDNCSVFKYADQPDMIFGYAYINPKRFFIER